MPQTRTLHEPSTEHDACGFGFVVDVAGRPSHAIVRDALTVLVNLEHRGASGSEANTGDGAGILLALPHAFLRAVAAEAGHQLPERGFGVAQVFLPRDAVSRNGAQPSARGAQAASRICSGANSRPCNHTYTGGFTGSGSAGSQPLAGAGSGRPMPVR